MNLKLLPPILLLMLSCSVHANDEATLGEKLKPLFGDLPDAITATPIEGIYQASFGMELIYVSKDGRYFFSGDMIDGSTRTNLSEDARTTARKTEMTGSEAEGAITFKAKGVEKHVLSVFTDVTCPYCTKLHKEVPKLNEAGVTVNYMAYPRAGIGSDSYKQMVSIWCAKDQQAALTKAKNGATVDVKSCDNPVANHFALGKKVSVSGTPALVTASGALIPGYRPAEELVKMLESSKTGVVLSKAEKTKTVEPTPIENKFLELYKYSYKSISTICDLDKKPKNVDLIIKFLSRKDIGKVLGIHSHDGMSAKLFEENREAAAELWPALWISQLGEKNGCLFLNMVMTKDPSITEQFMNKFKIL
jgi:thiol:disulfide interchange protein DsbC